MITRAALLLALLFSPACASNSGSAADDAAPTADITTDTGSDAPVAPPGCIFPAKEVPAACGTCHGAPPDLPTHPPNQACSRCHGHVVNVDYEIISTDLHKNGTTDVAVGCTSCHGWNLGVSPPQGLTGECEYGGPGVGAHAAMRRDPIPAHRVGCVNCHLVPLDTWDEGHIDGDNVAEVIFRGLAVANGATPIWDGEACSGVYCHGATLEGGTHTNPGWFDTDGAASACGACHRLTDPEGNPDADCHACHSTSVGEDQQPLPLGTHIDGRVDLDDDAR